MANLPVPKDPTTVAIEKGLEEAAAIAKEYIDKLLAPALEEGGGIIGDTVGYWRFKNKVNLVLKAKAFLEGKGIQPAAVLPKIVVPILEAGSLETDVDMQARWAALLANAADPSVPEILPGYANMLSQFTPMHAAILDDLYKSHGDSFSLEPEPMADLYEWTGYQPTPAQTIIEKFGISKQQYNVLASDLHRLQVIDGDRWAGGAVGPSPSGPTSYLSIHITPLGRAFVRACRPPASQLG